MSAAHRSEPSAPTAEVFFPVPVHKERIDLIATLVFTRIDVTEFGETMKGLFLCEGELGRFKLWGTVPGSLRDEIDQLALKDRSATLKGSIVKFSARVMRGDREDFFGFFTHPTKARVIVAGMNGRER